MIHVAVTNESKAMTDAQIGAIVEALQIQVSRDFAPLWGVDAQIAFYPRGKQPADAWWLAAFDTSDQAGALGYHDVTPKGLPLGKAFVGSDIQAGYSPSVTISHELLEMLGDPEIDMAVQIGTSTWYAYEACDACEADALGYQINGVLVSDFVTPQWFRSNGTAPFDFGKHLKKPLQIAKGGYIGIWTAHGGWTQKTAEGHVASHLDRARVGSRRERRRTPREQWVPSSLDLVPA
jgi:hypothetical protein